MESKRLGKYILIEKIGKGATAEVYRARDSALDREVIVKILRPDLMANSNAQERFRREIRLVKHLSHPAIVTVLDDGEQDGHWFMVMSSVEGESLREHLERSGRLNWDQVLKLARQIGEALDDSHAKGVLHRDVKPDNILVTPEGNFVLTDFGLARDECDLTHTISSETTADREVLGTLGYIAPEVWGHQPASPASDQYALACVIYEAWTGRSLARGNSPLVEATFVDALPRGPVAALRKALDPDPRKRYPTLHDLIDALAQNQGENVLSPKSPGASLIQAAEPVPAENQFQKMDENAPPNWWIYALGSTFFLSIPILLMHLLPLNPNAVGLIAGVICGAGWLYVIWVSGVGHIQTWRNFLIGLAITYLVAPLSVYVCAFLSLLRITTNPVVAGLIGLAVWLGEIGVLLWMGLGKGDHDHTRKISAP